MNIIEAYHRQWSEAMDQPQAWLPVKTLDETTRALRLRLHREELRELLEAIERESVESIGKEALDLIWVGVGTLITIGWDLNAGFTALYRSNMSKLVNGKPIKDGGGKVLKGPNYKPPDFSIVYNARTGDESPDRITGEVMDRQSPIDGRYRMDESSLS